MPVLYHFRSGKYQSKAPRPHLGFVHQRIWAEHSVREHGIEKCSLRYGHGRSRWSVSNMIVPPHLSPTSVPRLFLEDGELRVALSFLVLVSALAFILMRRVPCVPDCTIKKKILQHTDGT